MSIEHESLSDIRRKADEAKFGKGILTIVVGMQFGSEAKGSVMQHLAPMMSVAVRTGAANAGHTVFHHGELYVNRQIPSGWINPETVPVIGAGAIISPEVAEQEIERIERILPIRQRLKIDQNAHVIIEDQIAEESEGDLGERIGSTSARSREGIGQAMADKVLRKARCVQVKDYKPFKRYACDTVDFINTQLDEGQNVIMEGSQGFGLSIDHGYFPYTTSRNATAAALAESIGVQPGYFVTDVIGVVRSYPIRVAGNSGPFPSDSRELSWEEMREITGNPNLKPEKTSVTGQVRRIATFSESQYLKACMVNRPTEICFTFADYVDPLVYMSDSISGSHEVMSVLRRLEEIYTEAPVTMVNTGPNHTIDLDWTRRSRLRQMAMD